VLSRSIFSFRDESNWVQVRGGGNSEGSICSFPFLIVVLVWLSVVLVLGLVWGQLSVGLELSMILVDWCNQVISFHCV
jgi:hypothetical protein